MKDIISQNNYIDSYPKDKIVRGGAQNWKYYIVECFWCNKTLKKRYDVFKREIKNRGHFCCRLCFGKEPSFKNARKEIMLSSNPFSGKKHSAESRKKISQKRAGRRPWNYGTGTYEKRGVNFSIWKRVRKDVLLRDGNHCYKCGGQFYDKNIHIHHLWETEFHTK